MLAPPCLAADLLIRGQHTVCLGQQCSFPEIVAQIQDAPCIFGELRISRENPYRWYRGRIASSDSQRHSVVFPMNATDPGPILSSPISAMLTRDRGKSNSPGSSHATALTATTTLGEKAGLAGIPPAGLPSHVQRSASATCTRSGMTCPSGQQSPCSPCLRLHKARS